MRSAELFCLALFTTAVPAAAFPAHILCCHDGDTCTTYTGVRICLAEIDAPEIDQPYGTPARDVLCEMIRGRDVDIEPRGTSYDRVVGLIRVGGVDISEAVVAVGAAWDYPQYDRDPERPALQEHARAAHAGLWADPAPIPPWTWRHSRAGRFTPQR